MQCNRCFFLPSEVSKLFELQLGTCSNVVNGKRSNGTTKVISTKICDTVNVLFKPPSNRAPPLEVNRKNRAPGALLEHLRSLKMGDNGKTSKRSENSISVFCRNCSRYCFHLRSIQFVWILWKRRQRKLNSSKMLKNQNINHLRSTRQMIIFQEIKTKFTIPQTNG